jgi:hypothetical protein
MVAAPGLFQRTVAAWAAHPRPPLQASGEVTPARDDGWPIVRSETEPRPRAPAQAPRTEPAAPAAG